jgi:hypothetical protein
VRNGMSPRHAVTCYVGRLFTASTPAIKVEVTAPIPGTRTPSLPSAGAMVTLRWGDTREKSPESNCVSLGET